MKIQNVNNHITYKENTKPIKSEEPIKSKNYDVIDIKSKSLSDKEAVNLDSIKNNIISQVNKETSADKVSRIKESINNKTYNIDVEEIVNKLLGQWGLWKS